MIANINRALWNIIKLIILLTILSAFIVAVFGCATTYNPDIKRAEYIDKFIIDERTCHEKGGLLIIEYQVNQRPLGRYDIPKTGTNYKCIRR